MIDTIYNTPYVTSEEIAKCNLVNFLKDSFSPDTVLIEELPFAGRARRADIVALGDFTWGFEIKSEDDDVTKAIDQLYDYCQFFDYSCLVTTNKQLNKVRDKVPNHIGIIVYGPEGINWLRRPTLRLRKNKDFLSSGIGRLELIQTLREANITFDETSPVHRLREIASKKITTKELESLALRKIRTKANAVYDKCKAFLEESSRCVPEDLEYMRYRDKVDFYLVSNCTRRVI